MPGAAPHAVMLALLVLLIVAVPLAWWATQRTIAYRREAALREARVLEALFVAREAADGGASIDVDSIFGGAASPAATGGGEAALQAAALQAEAFAHARQASAARSAAEVTTAATPAGLGAAPADRSAAGSLPRAVATPIDDADPPARPPAPVRDLVQVFYEARGFRSAAADRSARPIEAVLAHKADAQRSYAFVPLTEPPTETALRSMVERAHGIGQRRLLIAVERALTPGAELPAHGVRLLDRAAIEAQLARLDATLADRIRAKAGQRAGQRLKAG